MRIRFAFVFALVANLAAASTLNAAPMSASAPGEEYDPIAQADGSFMSILPDKVNMRAAPRADSLIQWVYVRAGLPVLVVEEYDNWRKILDPDGSTGWIREDMLSDRRTVIITGRTRTMFDRARADANPTYQVEPGNVGTVRICQGAWCRITIGSATGWILRTHLWGTFEGEEFDQ